MSQNRSVQTQNISGRRNISLSLQTRLVLVMLFIALVPLIIITIRDTLQTQQALTNGAEASLKSSAAQTANSLDTFIQTTLDSIAGDAQFIDFTTYLTLYPSVSPISQARALDLLNRLRDKSGERIISYALVDTKGNVLLDTYAINVKNNESAEAYFPQVKFNDKPIASVVTYSEDKTPIITFASKIKNINGEYVGILRAKYNAVILQDVIANSVGPSIDASVLVLDPLNIRMADTQHPELLQKSIVPLEQVDYLLAKDSHRFLDLPREEQATNYLDLELALDNASNQPFFRADISPNVAGDDTFAVVSMKTLPWTVAYSRSTSAFLSDVQKQIRTNIVLVISTSIIIIIIAVFVARSLTSPLKSLTKTANAISHGAFSARAEITTADEIGSLASAFNSMTDQLQSTLVGLEQRVADRTKALATSTEVSRRLSTILNEKELVTEVVNQVQNAFDYYHTQIYFYDEANENLVLAGGTGEAGEKMLAQGHKISKGRGLVGRAAESNETLLVSDTLQNPDWLPNPLLPDTKAEIAIPISIGDQVLGVLDVQHNVTDGLQREDVDSLQSIANQVAVALKNTRQYRDIQQFKMGIENSGDAVFITDIKGTITYANPTFEKVYGFPLSEVIGNNPRIIKSGLLSTDNYKHFWGALLSKNSVTGEIVNKHKDGHLVYIAGTNSAIVDDAGEIVGFLAVHHDITEQKKNQEIVAKNASQQQAINLITQKIQNTTSIESALQIAARELGHALGTQTSVSLAQSDKQLENN